jgi:hypothetical protein
VDYSDRKIIGNKHHPGADYQPVVVEIYHETKSGKGDSKHVRPIEGQPFSSKLDVQFDEQLKSKSRAGARFLIWGKLKYRTGTGDYVGSSPHWWEAERIE